MLDYIGRLDSRLGRWAANWDLVSARERVHSGRPCSIVCGRSSALSKSSCSGQDPCGRGRREDCMML